MPINIEIKAHCRNLDRIRDILRDQKADFKGLDPQTDSYFPTPNGRLKLREGNIENHLIFYQRPDQAGPKRSDVLLYRPDNSDALKSVLNSAFGIMKVVKKKREIYFIQNVKFHLDQVEGLGNFVEIEAIDTEGHRSEAELEAQCNHYLELFEISQEDLITWSYSDMINPSS